MNPTQSALDTAEKATITEITLRPCPFCGDVPRMAMIFQTLQYRISHQCPRVGNITIDWRRDDKDVADRWNGRVEEPEIQVMRESIKKLVEGT